MFKNWTTKKTIWTIVIILLLIAVAYQMKWLGNKKTLLEQMSGQAASTEKQKSGTCIKRQSKTGEYYYLNNGVEVDPSTCARLA